MAYTLDYANSLLRSKRHIIIASLRTDGAVNISGSCQKALSGSRDRLQPETRCGIGYPRKVSAPFANEPFLIRQQDEGLRDANDRNSARRIAR